MSRAIVLYAVALGILDFLRGRKLRIVYTASFNLDSETPFRFVDRVAEHVPEEEG